MGGVLYLNASTGNPIDINLNDYSVYNSPFQNGQPIFTGFSSLSVSGGLSNLNNDLKAYYDGAPANGTSGVTVTFRSGQSNRPGELGLGREPHLDRHQLQPHQRGRLGHGNHRQLPVGRLSHGVHHRRQRHFRQFRLNASRRHRPGQQRPAGHRHVRKRVEVLHPVRWSDPGQRGPARVGQRFRRRNGCLRQQQHLHGRHDDQQQQHAADHAFRRPVPHRHPGHQRRLEVPVELQRRWRQRPRRANLSDWQRLDRRHRGQYGHPERRPDRRG